MLKPGGPSYNSRISVNAISPIIEKMPFSRYGVLKFLKKMILRDLNLAYSVKLRKRGEDLDVTLICFEKNLLRY